MALDLKTNAKAVTDINDSGVFLAGLNKHVRPFGRESFEYWLGVFIRTVLAPHNRENSKLGKIRFATEDFLNT